MKFRKILLASPMFFIATSALIPLTTSCSSTKTTKPKVQSVEIRHAPINKISGAHYEPISLIAEVDLYHFNGSEIGYFSVEKYVNTFMQYETTYGATSFYTNYSASTTDGVTTITNLFNKSTCKVDYNKQTITFSDYDAFLCYETRSASPLAVGVGGGENYYTSITATYRPGNEFKINLQSKYNINIFLYNNETFLPFDVFRNVISPRMDITLFYNGRQLYQTFPLPGKATLDLYKSVIDEATTLTKENAELRYNLFALTLDTRFGLIERESRVHPGQTIKYFPNGAYAILSPYHDKLVSLEKNVANRAIAEIFAKYIDDGGHAGYQSLDMLCDTPWDDHELAYGEEKKNTFATHQKCSDARIDAKFDPKAYWTDPNRGDCSEAVSSGADNYYEEYTVTKKSGGTEKVAYVTFDEFKDVTTAEKETWTEKEKAAGRELLSATTKQNSWKNTLRMTMYANQQIQENGIKNVVIDLSNNGGGSVHAEHFIASWLCGGVTEKIYDPHTNAYSEYTVKADIDGDGVFDSDDYLPADVNLYVITSAYSFSCGNMLPCNLADCRPSTYFIGEKSGGGACFVDDGMNLGLGDEFRNSSNYHMLRNASSYNNYISVESGCPNDYAIDPRVNPEKLFNRSVINDKIVNGL